MKEQMQQTAFMLIAQAGTAKSMYIEAIQEAKKENFKEAQNKITEGDNIFNEAHKLHFDLVQKEAKGEDIPFSLLFMHAEDQLLNTETIKILSVEIIDLYKK